jgi:hypothetical protein
MGGFLDFRLLRNYLDNCHEYAYITNTENVLQKKDSKMAYKLSQSIDSSDLSHQLLDDLQDELCVANDLAYKVYLTPGSSQMKNGNRDRLMEELKNLGVDMNMEYCFINFSW